MPEEGGGGGSSFLFVRREFYADVWVEKWDGALVKLSVRLNPFKFLLSLYFCKGRFFTRRFNLANDSLLALFVIFGVGCVRRAEVIFLLFRVGGDFVWDLLLFLWLIDADEDIFLRKSNLKIISACACNNRRLLTYFYYSLIAENKSQEKSDFFSKVRNKASYSDSKDFRCVIMLNIALIAF